MTEELQRLIETQEYKKARLLADELFQAGENTEIFWILNATLYQIEGIEEAEFACISRGLQINPSNYELYYMLGNYYEHRNCNQAYLCYEQADYYCENDEDKALIQEAMDRERNCAGFEVHPTSIVILSYNIKDILKGCIQSIRNTCPESAYELVVVDNASDDGAAEWLKEQTDLVLQCNSENFGFAGGCNQGIELSSPQNDILLLNNDTIVPPNALFWLRIGLYERATVGAVGPITNYAGNDQALSEELGSVQEYLKAAAQICAPIPDPYENKVWLVGFAMLIKRRVLEEVGLLDTRYEWGNFEDNDYGMRVTQAGYELLLCYNSFIYHYGSLNMAKDEAKYRRFMAKNRQVFLDKWGIDISYYSYARIELVERIHAGKRDAIRVLELGCGCGATLARIKYLYPNAEVYGIELSEEAVKYGKYLGKIIAGNIETMELPYQTGMFDYILFGDVLEHLHDPQKMLCRVKELLKPDGVLITSIPNIMNISVIVHLLQGNFTYHDSGLLDRTHIHFFTRKEIEKMFRQCGFQITGMGSTCGREGMKAEDELLAKAVLGLPGIAQKEDFEVYQYLVEAVKGDNADGNR